MLSWVDDQTKVYRGAVDADWTVRLFLFGTCILHFVIPVTDLLCPFLDR